MRTDMPRPTDKCDCTHEYSDHHNRANANTLCQKCGCTKFWKKLTLVEILNEPIDDKE